MNKKAHYASGFHAGQFALLKELLTHEVVVYDKHKGFGTAVKLAVDSTSIASIQSVIDHLEHQKNLFAIDNQSTQPSD